MSVIKALQRKRHIIMLHLQSGRPAGKRAVKSSNMAENILKLELTHHNLISESVRHFPAEDKAQRKDTEQCVTLRHSGLLMQKFLNHL